MTNGPSGLRPDLDKPCQIMVAPNGARRTKRDHPALPMTPIDVAQTAIACADAGATAIHLHARDGKGQHTLSRHIYESFLIAVKRAVGDRMTIQITTEAVGRYTPDEQMAAVRDISPEAVSIALKEVLPEDADPAKAAAFFAWLDRCNVKTQFILYSPEEVQRFERLCQQGVIPTSNSSLLFVLGRYLEANECVEPRALNDYVAASSGGLDWMVCAFGREETACLTAAMCLGGHVRVGFENSLWLGNGEIAPDNAAKVAEICAIADMIGRRRQGL